MSSEHHYLQTETEYYQAVESGNKTFELRKNDRNFKLHDCIYLVEVVNRTPTGREMGPFEITYILHGGKYGLKDGYCILQWEQ